MDDDDHIVDDRAIAEQIARLGSQVDADDVERRRQIVGQIYDLCYAEGHRCQAAVPILLRCLSDPDEKVGESALWGLKYCAPESIDPLIDCLGDPDVNVRRRACSALGSIGDAACSGADSLRRLLTDPAADVRVRAAWALGLVHDTSPLTIDALFVMAASKSAAERAAAFHALGNVGQRLVEPTPFQVKQQQIVDTLQEDDEDVRRSACYVLESLCLDPSAHVKLLSRCWADTSYRVRSVAIDQLKELAQTIDLTEHVASMCDVVRKREYDAREMCDVLALLGTRAKEAVPCLLEALLDKNGSLVIAAAQALWKIDRRGEDCLRALAALFDEHGEAVCDAICVIGPPAAPLVPVVIRALQSDDWDLQWAAADALAAISSSDAPVLAALTESFGHPSLIVRSAAIRALAQIGPAAIPALIEILEDHENDRGASATCALGRMGPAAMVAVQVLRTHLRSPNGELASCSAIALAMIAGDATVTPMLVELLARSDRPDFRTGAAIGLKAIGPPAIQAADALTSALQDDDSDVRTSVEAALAAIKSQAH